MYCQLCLTVWPLEGGRTRDSVQLFVWVEDCEGSVLALTSFIQVHSFQLHSSQFHPLIMTVAQAVHEQYAESRLLLCPIYSSSTPVNVALQSPGIWLSLGSFREALHVPVIEITSHQGVTLKGTLKQKGRPAAF